MLEKIPSHSVSYYNLLLTHDWLALKREFLGVVIGELSDSTEEMMTQATVRFYKNFVPKPESGPTK